MVVLFSTTYALTICAIKIADNIPYRIVAIAAVD